MKNKKAIMSMLESFIAITLIIVIIYAIIEQGGWQENLISEKISSDEVGVLRAVQFNETCRADVLNSSAPVYWNNEFFPESIISEVTKRKPSYLECRAKICEIAQPCFMEEEIEKDVYSQSAFISANATLYSPKELRLFCWEK